MTRFPLIKLSLEIEQTLVWKFINLVDMKNMHADSQEK